MSANRSEVVGVTLAVASLTEEAGALLQQLLAAHPGEQLGLALRMPAEGPIDWSSLVLWMIATGTVTAGALWAGQGFLPGGAAGAPGARKPGGGAELLPSITISSHAAVGFVVMASTMLVVLFFFLSKWLAYILVSGGSWSSTIGAGAWAGGLGPNAAAQPSRLGVGHSSSAARQAGGGRLKHPPPTHACLPACCCRLQVGMFALGAWQACGTVLFSALQHASSSQWRGTYLRLPLAGLVPANGVAATAAAGALCATWAVWHNAVWSWPLQVGRGVPDSQPPLLPASKGISHSNSSTCVCCKNKTQPLTALSSLLAIFATSLLSPPALIRCPCPWPAGHHGRVLHAGGAQAVLPAQPQSGYHPALPRVCLW